MAFLRSILRVYSWIFEAIVCLAAILVPVLNMMGGPEQLNLDWLPWTGSALRAWLIGLGILGLIFVLLSIAGRLRILFFLFTIGVFAILARGLFFTTHGFSGPEEARLSFYVVLAALLAVAGAWPTSSGRARRYHAH